MYSRIIFYGLAGLWWGSLFGIIHLAMIMSETSGPRLLLADVGVTATVGALVGLTLGSILSFVPAQLRILSLARGLKSHLFPDDQKALHFRSRAAATCWTIMLFITCTLKLISWLYASILTRVQEPLFGAVAITLIGLLSLSVSLALAGVFRSVLSRLIENIVRRFPSLSPSCHPFGNLIAAVILLGLNLGLWLQDRQYLERAEVLVYVMPMLLTFLIALSGDFLERLLARITLSRARIVFIGGLFFFVTAGVAGIRSTQVQNKLSGGHSIAALVLSALQSPFDLDGDGFAPILGGQDCDDSNPLIYPGAVEIYGNQVDENCDGVLIAKLAHSTTNSSVDARTKLPNGPLNVVLITISNLRPDHLSFFGYERDTTPNLDAFAAGSVFFTKAYTPSPTLSYGLASLLSGQYASELNRTLESWPVFLSDNQFIAERLKQRGYATAAFLSHWYFDEGSGLNAGFDIWQPRVAEKGRTKTVASSEVVFERARNFLQTTPSDKPFFLWAHTIDPQRDYLEHMGIPRFGRDVIAQYDHELRYVDEMLGPLLKTLRERTDWNRTMVVLTSEQGHDFGESLPTGGLLPLSEVQQRIPLFVRLPGVRPRPIDKPVSLTRVFPMLLELTRPPARLLSPQVARQSLLRTLDDEDRRPEPILSELLTNRADQFSLSFIENQLKLHYDGNNRRWRLFNLDEDPTEQADQYASKPALAHQIRRALARYRSNMNLLAPK